MSARTSHARTLWGENVLGQGTPKVGSVATMSSATGVQPNRFTTLLGCTVPIQLAVMGGINTPELAGAVSACGGLGMLSGTLVPTPELIEQLAATRQIAGPGAPVGVGFLMPFLDRDAYSAAAVHADVVEGFYGDPDTDLVARAHDSGAHVSWQVGSLHEAEQAIAAGCDILVAQGVEAGGHVRGTTELDVLLGEVRPIWDGPLVAAGGIGTIQRARELFASGADALRLGTRFLACTEADVHPDYLARLIEADAPDTELTETFSLMWPKAPHRVLRSCIDASGADPSTRSPLPPNRAFVGDVTSAALYAGCSVGAVHEPTTVAKLMEAFGAAVANPSTTQPVL